MEHKRSTEAIVKMAREKSNKTREKVEKVIAKLSLEGQPINFNIVSKEAEISKSWLYSNKDIRTRIEEIRDKQKNLPKGTKKAFTQRSETSKDNIVTTLKEKIKSLEEENKKLRKQMESLYGKIYNQNDK